MKKRVTFEVDDNALFDRLREMNGDTDALGARLVSSLLAKPSLAEAIGMALYGVTYEGAEPVTALAQNKDQGR